jgi:uncharacterized protein YbjT (DUF2867 family)
MKVILFGASGMVGQGVLRECLADPGVTEIIAVLRSPLRLGNPKLREIVHRDFTDFTAIEPQLAGADACFFCLGVSSAGMSENRYSRITYDYTMAAAYSLVRLNPAMTFTYVSGVGTDSTEQGRSMWARVKGRTENALLKLPFRSFMFRPGFIQPLDGIRSRTPLYRAVYWIAVPLIGLWKAISPDSIVTTREVGKAMLKVARDGYSKPIIEPADIHQLA